MAAPRNSGTVIVRPHLCGAALQALRKMQAAGFDFPAAFSLAFDDACRFLLSFYDDWKGFIGAFILTGYESLMITFDPS